MCISLHAVRVCSRMYIVWGVGLCLSVADVLPVGMGGDNGGIPAWCMPQESDGTPPSGQSHVEDSLSLQQRF